MKIQKYILIVLTCFACVVHVIAQEKKPPGLPTGANVVIVDGPNGPIYSSAAGRFKILFPGVPQEFEGTIDTSFGQIASHCAMLVATDVTHLVNYTDYPMILEQPDVVKTVLDKGSDGALARVAKEDPH